MIRVRPMGPFGRLPVPSRDALRPLWAALAVAWSVLPPLLLAAAWATHVVACAMAGSWGLLLVGLALYPVTVIHGLAIWLGALL